MLLGWKQNRGVTSDPLDWIVLRSVWASWKWPRAAHWSCSNQSHGGSCRFLEGISAARSRLLRVNASWEPGGLSSWGWHCREGRLLCLEVEHSWGKHRSGNSLLSSPAGPADSISGIAEGNTGSHLGRWDWRARPRKETPSISPHSWEPSSHCGWVLHLWGSMRGSGQENP